MDAKNKIILHRLGSVEELNYDEKLISLWNQKFFLFLQIFHFSCFESILRIPINHFLFIVELCLGGSPIHQAAFELSETMAAHQRYRKWISLASVQLNLCRLAKVLPKISVR